jgi:acyl-CoA dehydrogenase
MLEGRVSAESAEGARADLPNLPPDRDGPPPYCDLSYRWDPREIAFHLWEFFRVEACLGQAPCERVTRGDVEALLERAAAHAADLARANPEGDRDPARLMPDGSVHIPAAFKALWEEHRRDWFWLRQQIDGSRQVDRGGKQLPHIVIQAVGEMFLGANASFMTYAGFTPAGATLIRKRGTPEQQAIFVDKLNSVRWDACFTATEPEAGSDLIAIKTSAQKLAGDVYAITGEKCYITAGMHDLTENTVHILLARTRGAASGPLSLSCFLVPRFWPNEDGSLSPNGVHCTRVADKMGLNGCANTHLRFGEREQTRGFLLGGKENVALLQMAHMMRLARIGTGQIALAMASSAYLHALDYARRRVQGARFDEASNPRARRVPIIEHPDVQRMLLDMKSRVEGSRILLGRIAASGLRMHQLALAGASKEEISRNERLSMVLAPIAKAHISDEGWRTISQALQVHGAVGYFRERPIEQYLRDSRILSIWEGTNYIQAQDLIRDKLRFGRESLLFTDLSEEIRRVIERARGDCGLAAEADALENGLDGLAACLDTVADRAAAKDFLPIAQFCTRVLNLFGAVTMAWGLVEAACIAADALKRDCGSDEAFYRGKIKSARFYLHNALAEAVATVPLIRNMAFAYTAMDTKEFGSTDIALGGAGAIG